MRLSKRELTLLGASLYLCEGTKFRIGNRGNKIYAVEFTNKDPRAIKIFLDFLRKVIKAKEDRVKAQLFVYPDHDILELQKYWSDITKIPTDRFNKTIELKQRNYKYKPNPLGVLKVRYHHKEHFLKIQGIIEEIFGEN